MTITFTSSQFVNQHKFLGQTPIVPKHIWETIADPATDPNKTPVGTGPYTLKSFTPQTTTLTVRTGLLAGAAGGQGAALHVVHRQQRADHRAGRRRAEWSFVFIPNYKTVFIDKDPAHHKVWAPPVLGIHGLYINTTKAPFDNSALRKAMSMVINREDIFNQAEAGYFHPLVTSVTGLPTPAGDAFIAPEYKGKTQAVDVEGAKKVLTGAGFKLDGNTLKDPTGKPVKLTLTDPAGWSDYQTSLEIVKDNLSKIGIAATVDKANQDAWFKNVEEGKFDATFRWTNGGATPYDIYQTIMDGTLLKPIGTASPAGNFGRFNSPEATEALKAYADATDDAARTTALNTLQKIFVEQVPMIPVGADNIGGRTAPRTGSDGPTTPTPTRRPAHAAQRAGRRPAPQARQLLTATPRPGRARHRPGRGTAAVRPLEGTRHDVEPRRRGAGQRGGA